MVMSGEGDEDAVRTAIDAARTWMQAWDDIGLCSRDYGVWSLECLAGSATGAKGSGAACIGDWSLACDTDEYIERILRPLL